jgi:ATP-dependent DNA helicase RecQ
MADLGAHDAFHALGGLLRGAADGSYWRSESPSIERLRIAMVEQPQRASALDLAVLLRQALRHEYARRGYAVAPTVVVDNPRFAGFEHWDRVGLRAVRSSEGRMVTAMPWKPAWLPCFESQGVEDYASSEKVCRIFNSPVGEGDPFLASVGRTSYRSAGQRAAVRAALSTPAGGTLVRIIHQELAGADQAVEIV